MRDTVQAKLMELGLLQPDASAGWEFTQRGRELISTTLSSPHESTLTKELLKLGVIERAPIGSGRCWLYTPRGRKVVSYLLNKSSDQEETE